MKKIMFLSMMLPIFIVLSSIVCITTVNASTVYVDKTTTQFQLRSWLVNETDTSDKIVFNEDVEFECSEGEMYYIKPSSVNDKSKTIDLNGHSVSLGDSTICGLVLGGDEENGLENSGTLNIIDSSVNKTGIFNNQLLVKNCEKRYYEDKTYCTNLTININGGTYTAPTFARFIQEEDYLRANYADNINFNISNIKFTGSLFFENYSNNVSLSNIVLEPVSKMSFLNYNKSVLLYDNLKTGYVAYGPNGKYASTTNINDINLKETKLYVSKDIDLVNMPNFDNKYINYEIQSRTLNLNNPTNNDIAIKSIKIDNEKEFNLVGNENITLKANESLDTNYTISTKSGLGIGTHKTNIIITDEDGNYYIDTISFEVVNYSIPKPTISSDSVFIYDGNEKNISFDNYNDNYMTISGDKATEYGKHEATITLKTGYCWEDDSVDSLNFNWEIVALAESITINGPTKDLKVGKTHQYTAEVLPEYTLNKEVVWSVENGTGEATIDENGLLTAISEGTVVVKAAAKDGSNIIKTLDVTLKKFNDVEHIYIESPNKYLETSKSLYMKATVYPLNASNKEVTWSSSNTSIASINSTTGGMTTSTKTGLVTITATAKDGSGVKGTITFLVGYPHIKVGETTSVGNSSYVTYDTVEWTIGNENILQKTGQYGKNSVNNHYWHSIYVRGVSNGNSTVTMKTISGNTLAQSTVYVYTPPTKLDNEDQNIKLEKDDTKQLNINITPDNVSNDLKELHYISEDSSVATVSNTGLITAKSLGKTNIKVYSQYYDLELTIPVEVVVFSSSIEVNSTSVHLNDDNKEFQLTYQVKPDNATDKEVTFESSDDDIVTVSDTGLIKAVGNGNAVITIKAKDGKSTKGITVQSDISVPIEKVSITEEEITVDKGDSKSLVVIISPKGTTMDKSLSWKSDDETIASVNQNGEVTGVKKGNTVITVTTSNGKTAQCDVVVTNPKIFSVTVDLNGGTGDLSYPLLAEEDEFEVTEPTGVTPPKDKKFAGFEIDGKDYMLGDKYIVNDNFDAKIIWHDKYITLTNEVVIEGFSDYVYNKECKLPNIKVIFNDSVLIQNKDYMVSSYGCGNEFQLTIKGKGNYTGTVTKSFKIKLKSMSTLSVGLSATDYVYNGKVRTPNVIVKDNDELLSEGYEYYITYQSGRKNVGTYKVTITGSGNYTGSITKTFKINKANNPLAVKTSVKTVKRSKVRWKAQTVKAITVSKNQGKVKYYKTSGSSKITVNKATGKLTVKKKTKKGTYKIKVKVIANGNSNYKSGYKIVTVKIRVK